MATRERSEDRGDGQQQDRPSRRPVGLTTTVTQTAVDATTASQETTTDPEHLRKPDTAYSLRLPPASRPSPHDDRLTTADSNDSDYTRLQLADGHHTTTPHGDRHASSSEAGSTASPGSTTTLDTTGSHFISHGRCPPHHCFTNLRGTTLTAPRSDPTTQTPLGCRHTPHGRVSTRPHHTPTRVDTTAGDTGSRIHTHSRGDHSPLSHQQSTGDRSLPHSGGITPTSEAGVASTTTTVTATSHRSSAGYPTRDTADNRSTQTRTPQERDTLDDRHDPASHDHLTDTALAARKGQPTLDSSRSTSPPLHAAGGRSAAGGLPPAGGWGSAASTTDDPQRSHRIRYRENLSAT